jgi:hypothetical protein
MKPAFCSHIGVVAPALVTMRRFTAEYAKHPRR